MSYGHFLTRNYRKLRLKSKFLIELIFTPTQEIYVVMVDPGLLGDVRQGQLYLEM